MLHSRPEETMSGLPIRSGTLASDGIAAPIAQSQRGKLPRLCVWYFLVWRFCLKSSNFTLYKVLPRTLELRMCTQAKMGVLI